MFKLCISLYQIITVDVCCFLHPLHVSFCLILNQLVKINEVYSMFTNEHVLVGLSYDMRTVYKVRCVCCCVQFTVIYRVVCVYDDSQHAGTLGGRCGCSGGDVSADHVPCHVARR